MIAQCDYVVLSTPYTPDTHQLIDAAAIAAMKPNAVFINVGRGKCVDEEALVKGAYLVLESFGAAAYLSCCCQRGPITVFCLLDILCTSGCESTVHGDALHLLCMLYLHDTRCQAEQLSVTVTVIVAAWRLNLITPVACRVHCNPASWCDQGGWPGRACSRAAAARQPAVDAAKRVHHTAQHGTHDAVYARQCGLVSAKSEAVCCWAGAGKCC